ncbi:MAG: DUF11 domain-containing protein [Planctomycetota bacterium]|nr:DUF11 domain-containing protein [Planctomycetota bacterium]
MSRRYPTRNSTATVRALVLGLTLVCAPGLRAIGDERPAPTPKKADAAPLPPPPVDSLLDDANVPTPGGLPPEPLVVDDLAPAPALPEPNSPPKPAGNSTNPDQDATLNTDLPAAGLKTPKARIQGILAPSDPAVQRVQGASTPIPKGTAKPPGSLRDANPPSPGGSLVPREAPPATTAADPVDPFVLPADRLGLGPHTLNLAVDVQSPAHLNLNQTANFKLVVKNSGATDALEVVVRDRLPDGLEFVSSRPEALRGDGGLLIWRVGTLAAGSDRVITLRVKPTRTGSFDHAATVSMLAGGKSRSIVREPRLKVELVATPAKVLKGQPVRFQITVSNPGDGPARDVKVLAKLSPGLRQDPSQTTEANLFDQTIDSLGPGERKVLDTLEFIATQGGDQSCDVYAESPDVVAGAAESRMAKAVQVVEPRLALALNGPAKRYTDMLATYAIKIDNPGTATARNVKVTATLPLNGKLANTPSGARWLPESRKLIWSVGDLDPAGSSTLSFQIRTGGVGFYQLTADARGDNALQAKAGFSTDVTGIADVVFDVSEKMHVLDVGDQTTYIIKIKNVGTKEATRVLVSAELSPNVEPLEFATKGVDNIDANFITASRRVVFNPIEHLPAGQEAVLGIKVKANAEGLAKCRVYLIHDDIKDQLDEMAATRVTDSRRQ